MPVSLPIKVKRVYETPSASDGVRVLVDRLWPRGLAKAEAKIDLWLKEVAPSAELRRWFGHTPERWEEFRRRYLAELESRPQLLAQLDDLHATQALTLLFAAHDEAHNNAVVLCELLSQRPHS